MTMTATNGHVRFSEFMPRVTQYRGSEWVETIAVHPTARRFGVVIPVCVGPATAAAAYLLLIIASEVTGDEFLSWMPDLAMKFRAVAEASMPAMIVAAFAAGCVSLVLLIFDRRMYSVAGQWLGLAASVVAAGCAVWVGLVAAFGIALVAFTIVIWAVIIAFWVAIGIGALALLGALADR